MNWNNKLISLTKDTLKSIWFIIKSIDFKVFGAIAIRTTISLAFFIIIVMLFPRSKIYWIAYIQLYFFFTRMIISFTNILDLKESNKTFFNRKIKYIIAWEYYEIRDLCARTFSKNFFNHKSK